MDLDWALMNSLKQAPFQPVSQEPLKREVEMETVRIAVIFITQKFPAKDLEIDDRKVRPIHRLP